MTTQLLIDADFSLFRDTAAVEKDTCFPGSTTHILHSDEDEAFALFMRTIERIETALNGEAILVFSGDQNFRKTVWPLYKANRKSSRKPLCYFDIIERVKAERTVKSHAVLEGDDYIGILATRVSPVRRIIVSDDKDMLTLPNCEVYRMGQIITTTVDSAETYWLTQTLMGDTTDGYKGCPGIGPKTAEKVLERPGDPWVNILEAYRKGCEKKPSALTDAQVETADELALVNARLARILRATDWDGNAPILWSPS